MKHEERKRELAKKANEWDRTTTKHTRFFTDAEEEFRVFHSPATALLEADVMESAGKAISEAAAIIERELGGYFEPFLELLDKYRNARAKLDAHASKKEKKDSQR